MNWPSAPWVVGALAALWAAVIGLALAALPMLLVWMTTPDSGLTWTESLRLAALLWLVANGAAITIGGLTISLLPWGLAIIPLVLLGYVGAWSARRTVVADPRGIALLVGPGAVAYAAVAGIVAWGSAGPTSSVTVVGALTGALVIAVLGLGWGAIRGGGLLEASPVPRPVATVVRGGFIAAFALIGFGAIAATTSLVLHMDDAVTMSQSLAAGLAGGLGLLALGIAYVPVLAMWGTAYVMGAGVVLGPGVTVSPFIAASAPTQLPPFPALAALPQGATVLAWLLPLAGVLAGVLAGLSIARTARAEQRLVRLMLAGGAAVVAGALLALGAFVSSGALGDLRLAQVGPVPLTVGVLGAVLVALGAAPCAVVPRSPERPRLAVADRTPAVPQPDSLDDDAPLNPHAP